VLHNVVLNAKQAMPQGGTIHVRAENVALEADSPLPLPAGQYVKIALDDQGHGIAQEHLEKIFDPYFTTKETGNGLGLASAYAIVTKHGGYITATSTLGVGTTFLLYLPAADAAPVTVRSVEMHACLGTGKLLLMDDEGTVRVLARQILTLLGYDVVEACDGHEALHLYTTAQAAGEPFAAVLLDLTIPGGIGGCETLERLRVLDPHVRAIVTSGYADDPVITNFRRYGFAAALTKPYTIAALSEVLHKVL
jgi:CheY-like chemotaxis protein